MRLLSIFSLVLLLSACTSLIDKPSTSNAFTINQIGSQQLVLVITDDDEAINGQLTRFEKVNNQWRSVANSHQVVIGRTGLAWGIGLHPKQAGYHKQEGDGKAPAGIFNLSASFGYLDQISTGLDYQQMSADDFCIDVKGSPYYNQTVNRKAVGEKAVEGSSEPMRRDIHKQDKVYKKGIFVDHNPQNVSGQGSCIFVHLWRQSNTPTAGCTAMAEGHLDVLLNWLDKSASPILVALTAKEYRRLKPQWQLP